MNHLKLDGIGLPAGMSPAPPRKQLLYERYIRSAAALIKLKRATIDMTGPRSFGRNIYLNDPCGYNRARSLLKRHK